jgi:hypothetical protein
MWAHASESEAVEFVEIILAIDGATETLKRAAFLIVLRLRHLTILFRLTTVGCGMQKLLDELLPRE